MNDDIEEKDNKTTAYGEEATGLPFGAPGFMYALFSLFCSGALTWISGYVGQVHVVLPLLCLTLAIMLFVEAVLLLFFEPTVTLGEDRIRYRANRPSIWSAPPRLFRWNFSGTDEEIPLSSFEQLELDYTTVPFPLPIFPFTTSFFRITRWMLTLRRDNGEYYLMAVGPAPASFRELIEQANDHTDLPLSVPWKRVGKSKTGRNEETIPENWTWSPVDPSNFSTTRFLRALRHSDLPFRDTEEGPLELPIRNPSNLLFRTFGGGLASLGLLFATVMIFVGLRFNTDSPGGLFQGLFWMVIGLVLGGIGFLILAEQISPFQSRLIIHEGGIQAVYPLRRSSFIRFQDLIAVRGVGERSGPSTAYGLGKPVPCLEFYSASNWFYISLNDTADLQELYRVLRRLKKVPPVT